MGWDMGNRLVSLFKYENRRAKWLDDPYENVTVQLVFMTCKFISIIIIIIIEGPKIVDTTTADKTITKS